MNYNNSYYEIMYTLSWNYFIKIDQQVCDEE